MDIALEEIWKVYTESLHTEDVRGKETRPSTLRQHDNGDQESKIATKRGRRQWKFQRHGHGEVDTDRIAGDADFSELITKVLSFLTFNDITFDTDSFDNFKDLITPIKDALDEGIVGISEYDQKALNKKLKYPPSPSFEVYSETFDITSSDGEIITLVFTAHVKTRLWQDDTMGEFNPYRMQININDEREFRDIADTPTITPSGMRKGDRNVDKFGGYAG